MTRSDLVHTVSAAAALVLVRGIVAAPILK